MLIEHDVYMLLHFLNSFLVGGEANFPSHFLPLRKVCVRVRMDEMTWITVRSFIFLKFHLQLYNNATHAEGNFKFIQRRGWENSNIKLFNTFFIVGKSIQAMTH